MMFREGGQPPRVLTLEEKNPHYCRESGNELVSAREEDGVLVVVVRKAR